MSAGTLEASAAIIIGVDCATDPSQTGLARAELSPTGLVVQEAKVGSRRSTPVEIILNWLQGSGPVLIAMDAPLGWPRSLGSALRDHLAGQCPVPSANQLFRRATDDAIHQRLGKRPLDVGADRIARTARAALALLEELRRKSGQAIPLCWTPNEFANVMAIEVYPAATRIAHGAEAGSGSLSGLDGHVTFSAGCSVPESIDARDAVVCALAAADFLRGQSVGPEDLALAKREGWIWAGLGVK